MIPINKLVEDIAIFMEQRVGEGSVVVKTDATLRNEVVLFANDLSEKYEDHVSVELVDTLITVYNDSRDKEKDDCSPDDLLYIDDGVDLSKEED